ncbi:MAG: phosphatidylglycerophosphatase A [Methylococcaceae bacterium]|jgi:phosphatidylglycerophosphatase A|nr:MAG: phosphatidylglycerophosphatase A [Methylococcaceae bacterium]
MSIFLDKIGQNKFTPKKILTDPVLFLAFGFGAGLAKKAPGTWGTLVAVPIYLLIVQNFYLFSFCTILACCVGVWICGNAAEKLGEHDFSGIVWDEIAGFLVTMLFVPCSWTAVFMGFIVFRFFDILKPWPISVLDRHVKGGFGIMIDDICAGVFSGGVLFFLLPLMSNH